MTWKIITFKKEAGSVEILEGTGSNSLNRHAVLVDGSTGVALGPIFNDYDLHHSTSSARDTAHKFLDWHSTVHREDVRRVPTSTLMDRVKSFFQKFHQFEPWEGGGTRKAGLCGTCGLHFDRHAEAKIAGKTCENCNGTGQEPGESFLCVGCNGAKRTADYSDLIEHSGMDENGNYIENDVEEDR